MRLQSVCTILLVGLTPCLNAGAEESAAPQTSPTPAVAEAPAANSEAAQLQAVTVTAEKTRRSLLNTATSAAVLDQSDLESRAGLTTAKDVLASTPNVVLVGTGNVAPTVRGVDGTGAAKGADAFFAGSRPRLSVQIDGRPASYNEIVFGDSALWDVEHVEVLLGPQSTLQGRNAIAGTVATTTNGPTFYDEAALRLGGGNFNQRRASGLVSGPIIDDLLAFRIAADYLSKSSFVKGWTSFPTVDDPRAFRALNLRGKLLLQPSPIKDLKSLLTLNYSDYRGPQTEDVDRPFPDRRSSFPHEPVFQPRTASLISDTQYVIGSRLTFQGLFSATDLNVKRKADPGDGIVDIDGREYVFEPSLRYAGEGRTSGVTGLYLFRSSQHESIDFPGDETFRDHVTTAAAFGEATVEMTSALDAIAGLRFERERHQRKGSNVNRSDPLAVSIDVDQTDYAFLPKLGLAWHVTPKATLGAFVARGYNGGGGGFVVIPDPADGTRSEITNYGYAPEHVWTYEGYARQELAGKRLRLTANLFHSSYRNMQLSFDLTPANPTDFSFIVMNASKVNTYGAEFGATWLVLRGLEVYANAGLLKTRITKYPGSGFQGNRLPDSPGFTSAAGITWKRRGWDASLNARYASVYYSDIENNARGKAGDYWLANSQLGYTIWRVHVYGTVSNLFDSVRPLAVGVGPAPADDTASIPQPRSYWLGAQISY